MTNIVVTGASGFIGSQLVDQLLEKGYDVIGIDNMRTGKKENLSDAMNNDKFQLLIADIRDDDLASHIDSDVDVIYHLAAISSVTLSIEDPRLVNDVNASGTVNILELARKLNAKRVVFSSSAAVYGDPEEMPVREDFALKPLSPYAASKIAAEMYIRSYSSSYDIDSTILRYFNVYGPRQAFSEYSGVVSIFTNHALVNKPIKIEGDGEQTRSFVHVSDVARATILSGELNAAIGATINISGKDLISIRRLAHLMKENVQGCDSEIVHVAPRLGDVKDSIGSMERAQKLLGFTPSIPLERGLQETSEWYRAHQDTK
ncbi:MAG: SDR family NAD(P)-dependent oxidoreductase [Candidatus Thorarchaeota archaeon]|nr:SDR family NAD(P)-dependent oxidoreductase [Candidatus Thorarchaeota archaeon]